MDREQVYEIINEERDYQDSKHPSRPSISQELIMMEHYLSKARKSWVTKGGEETLKIMRKLAAVSVRCFENNGCPPRKSEVLISEQPDPLTPNLKKSAEEWKRRQMLLEEEINGENKELIFCEYE